MADPANTKLGRMLLDKITPVVMVLSTRNVEDSCRKNGLSLIEMLSPFCNFDNVDVPVRTASDQPYRLRKFKLRLFYASEIRQPDNEATRERLKQVVSVAGETDFRELTLDSPNLDIVPSWLQTFNRELVDAVSFSEHEAFDHPVACLVAVSSKDENPIDKCVDLFNSSQLPSLLNDGAMDPKILKLFLLLHDNQDGKPEITTEIFSEMRITFGTNASHLLCINSSNDGMEQHQENPWSIYNLGPPDGKKPGCLLNVDDIEELRSIMHDISSKRIIPHMEVKIRVLNQQISATRKGFRNQIKNLWWRKGKDDVVENPNGPMYTFSSVESQIRVLGDYGFMLHDYELALSNYRLISTDYKLDKAWKHYAGVQEAMGLAYFMLDQSRKDAEYCMENAFNTYLLQKIGPSSIQSAIRCGIWWAEMLKARDQFKDAAAVYFRISGEDPLHSAAMLEQASFCFLLSTPCSLRKGAFHLVLSGQLYKKCDQIRHAIRTYKYALSILKSTSWGHIKDHVHYHIGKWYASLGMFDEAITHLLEVLSCSHQSKATQELFLKDFLQIVQETGKKFELPILQLPVINPHSITVFYEDHRTYASPQAALVRESLWRSLEDDMILLPSSVKTNWLEPRAAFLSKKYEKSNVCVVGETIKVDIGFRNPLQIPISLSNVTLICRHSVEQDKTEPDTNGPSVVRNELRIVSGEFHSDASLFSLSEVDICIQGCETVMVQLMVTPKVEGHLKLAGVRWRLSDVVIGTYEFNFDVSRRKLPKGKRKGGNIVKVDTQFLVIKSLPRLEGAIKQLPERVYAGDLRCLTLELRNLSKISVKNLKMRINNPSFITVAEQDASHMHLPSGLQKPIDSSKNCMQFNADQAHGVFVFPNIKVSNETPLQWPLWFRAATAGSASLLVTICYEIEDEASPLKYRTLRTRYDLEVLPSLEVSFKTSPCPTRLQELLVRMDVLNRTSSESFLIRQLSCVGYQWELELLQPIESAISVEVRAGQALSSFFKLKNCRVHSITEDGVSLEMPRVTDVRLVDSDSMGLLETSTPPFVSFHYQERRKQEVQDQDHGKTVDFILVSSYGMMVMPPHLDQAFTLITHATAVTSTNPVWGLIEGPRLVRHNFSESFCEVKLKMTIYNSLEDAVSVIIETVDSPPQSKSAGSAPTVSGNEVGWHDTSRLSEMRVTTDVMGTRVAKAAPPESVPAFVWSGTSSSKRTIEPMSSTLIPLQITVFSPGTFDLSNYTLHWNRISSQAQDYESGSKSTSGICHGQSYHIAVLPREPNDL